jgi:hypothetical protein
VTPLFLFILPAVGFFMGLFSQRANPKNVIAVVLVLGLAFVNVVSTTARVGRIDFVNTILPPLLAIAGFAVGFGIRVFFMSARRY